MKTALQSAASVFVAWLLSACAFQMVSAACEFVYANYISSRPPFPDQQSLTLLMSDRGLETWMFAVPFLIGALLSWSAVRSLTLRSLVLMSLGLAVISAFLFTVVGGLEVAEDPRITVGGVLALPVGALVLTVLGIRYAASRNGTQPSVPPDVPAAASRRQGRG